MYSYQNKFRVLKKKELNIKIEAYQPKKSSQKVKVENKISPIIKD